MKTNWTELRVYLNAGDEAVTADSYSESLGHIVEHSPTYLDTATITGGEIAEWPQVFIAEPGEDPDYDTPHMNVDWIGFQDALEDARGSHTGNMS
jgi:hypothetical protein